LKLKLSEQLNGGIKKEKNGTDNQPDQLQAKYAEAQRGSWQENGPAEVEGGKAVARPSQSDRAPNSSATLPYNNRSSYTRNLQLPLEIG